MAIDAAELETLRDKLIRARAQGVKEVLSDGERVVYRDDAEMAAAIADLERRIAKASSPRAVAFSTSKGL